MRLRAGKDSDSDDLCELSQAEPAPPENLFIIVGEVYVGTFIF